MAGVSDKNARSYSSASTTYSSRPPTRALPPHRATRPPASPVGSRPAAAHASVAITVVVVLPCVPATATTVPPATACPRSSARRPPERPSPSTGLWFVPPPYFHPAGCQIGGARGVAITTGYR